MMSAAGSGSPRYVPDTGWSDKWAGRFYERWYGKQLRAMGERPLALKRGTSRSFRFLALPNRQGAFAFRVEFRSKGSALLRWVELDGYGGYAPGKILQEGRRDLRPAERRRLAEALAKAALSSRPREWDGDEITTNADGSQSLVMCHHATHYIFEEVEAGGRHYVQRRNCWVEEPLEQLKDELFRLAMSGRPPMRKLGSERPLTR